MDLGIPYYVMKFKEEFRKNVMDYFAGEYVEGRTPNPCIANTIWSLPLDKFVDTDMEVFFSIAIGASSVSYTHLDVYKRQV